MSVKELVISRTAIDARIKELGEEITGDYQDKSLVVVGALNGAFVFLADLIRAINLPLVVDFVRASSYGDETHSCGEVRLSKDIDIDVSNREVLIVEDIVDTGRTLACLKDYFAERGAASVRVCALINKLERREVEVCVDYIGFEVGKGFLIGYGLDYAEQYRNLPEVYHLKESVKCKV
jgi:hypoxanthine phosphoribosyltransferase